MVAVQVRDVPDSVRRALMREAQSRGQSLQVFLLEVLEREAADATNRDFLRTYRGPLADGGKSAEQAAVGSVSRPAFPPHTTE